MLAMSHNTSAIQSNFPPMKVDVSLCGSAPRSSFRPEETGKMTSQNSVKRLNTCSVAAESSTDGRLEVTDGPRVDTSKPMVTVAETLTCQVDVPETPMSPKSMLSPAIYDTDGDRQFRNQKNSSPRKFRKDSSSDTLESGIPSWAVPADGHSILLPTRRGGALNDSIDLTGKSTFHFGRSPSSDVMLSHKTCSRRHAAVFHHPSGICYLKDCASSHGTFVNGAKVSSKTLVRLRSGNLIRFGGPGAESYLLKSFSTSFTRMVADVNAVVSGFESSPVRREVNQSGVACIRGDCGMACVASVGDAPVAALVLLNTRLNALGGTWTLSEETKSMVTCAKRKFEEQQNIIESSFKADCNALRVKKAKLSLLAQTSLFQDPCTFVTPSTSTELSTRKRRRVAFVDEKPIIYFPPSVTPDNFSSDDEHSVGNDPASESSAMIR